MIPLPSTYNKDLNTKLASNKSFNTSAPRSRDNIACSCETVDQPRQWRVGNK